MYNLLTKGNKGRIGYVIRRHVTRASLWGLTITSWYKTDMSALLHFINSDATRHKSTFIIYAHPISIAKRTRQIIQIHVHKFTLYTSLPFHLQLDRWHGAAVVSVCTRWPFGQFVHILRVTNGQSQWATIVDKLPLLRQSKLTDDASLHLCHTRYCYWQSLIL